MYLQSLLHIYVTFVSCLLLFALCTHSDHKAYTPTTTSIAVGVFRFIAQRRKTHTPTQTDTSAMHGACAHAADICIYKDICWYCTIFGGNGTSMHRLHDGRRCRFLVAHAQCTVWRTHTSHFAVQFAVHIRRRAVDDDRCVGRETGCIFRVGSRLR